MHTRSNIYFHNYGWGSATSFKLNYTQDQLASDIREINLILLMKGLDGSGGIPTRTSKSTGIVMPSFIGEYGEIIADDVYSVPVMYGQGTKSNQ